jgi:glutathione S-transferase
MNTTMSKPIVIGFPVSTYVWTTRAALNFKGVEYELQVMAPGDNRAPEHLARHPWGKVPAFVHGDFTLYETTAICAYIDAAFEGPALLPPGPCNLARAHQIISIANCYLYPTAVSGYVLQYIFPSGPGKTPNREIIDRTIPEVRRTLKELDRELGDNKWFAGESLSLADLFVGPLVFASGMFPEGEKLMAGLDNLGRWKGQLASEPKFMSVAPKT